MANKEKTNQTLSEEMGAIYGVPRKTVVRTRTPGGDRFVIPTRYYVDNITGEKKAEPDPDNKFDLHEKIQASREACDMAVIVQKYLNGDLSVVNVKVPSGVSDTTILAKNEYQAQELARQAYLNFQTLPEDIKALFNNDHMTYYEAIMNKTAVNIINQAKQTTETKATEGGAE